MSELKRGGVRPPAVVGLFYEAAPRALRRQVEGLMERAADRPSASALPGEIRALLIPHAGFAYSGPVAAQAWRTATRPPRRVIVVAPSHTVAFRGLSVGDFSAYETPPGPVPVDLALQRVVGERDLLVVSSDLSHFPP